jgi:hypothetical protein
MFTKFSSRGSVTKFQKTLIIAIALAVLFLSIPLEQAQAFYVGQAEGTVGKIVLPVIYAGDIHITCVKIYAATVCPPVFTLYAQTGPVLYRSPAFAGSQIVQGMYVVEQWDGSKWLPIAQSNLLQAQIGATKEKVSLAQPYMPLTVGQGYFRFTWIFSWFSSKGDRLGSTIVLSNNKSEHECVTPARLCLSYDGFIRTGGYLTNEW